MRCSDFDPLRGDRAAARSRGHYPLSLSHLDPDTLSFDELTTHDLYLAERKVEPTSLAMVVDRLLDHLPEGERECVHLTVVSGMTLGEAARMLEWVLPSGDTDRKKVARHVERGLDQMRVWLTSAPWIRALVGELLPQES